MRFRQALFWDVDPNTIDSNKNAAYIIERILDFGNDAEVRWVRQNYNRKLIAKVVRRSRVLHDKSKALWSLIYR